LESFDLNVAGLFPAHLLIAKTPLENFQSRLQKKIWKKSLGDIQD